MATTIEIAAILDRLIAAFPNAKLENRAATIEVYADKLADIPGYLLEQSTERCIETSKWLPTVAELRDTAVKISGVHSDAYLRVLEEMPVDKLQAEYIELVRLFCQGPRELDASRWEHLAERLERLGREHKAKQMRKRLDSYAWVIDVEHTPLYAKEYEKKRKRYEMPSEEQLEDWRDRAAEARREAGQKEYA